MNSRDGARFRQGSVGGESSSVGFVFEGVSLAHPMPGPDSSLKELETKQEKRI